MPEHEREYCNATTRNVEGGLTQGVHLCDLVPGHDGPHRCDICPHEWSDPTPATTPQGGTDVDA